MKQLDEKTKSLLAGEYVLGLLNGRARARFEALLENDEALNNEVEFWQEHFSELTDLLEPATPPEYIWDSICERISLEEIRPKRKFSFGLEFWNGFASATVMALLIGFFVFNGRLNQDIVLSVNDYIAVLEDQQSRPILIASISNQESALILQMLKPASHDSNNDLQVWCLPKTDDPPMSMGIISRSGITKFVLTHEEMALLKEARALAISVEPKGGSEQPTGPVLYSGLSI